MQQDHLDFLPAEKVYSTKMIVISSFFGGVLASGYMIYKNFMVFGSIGKAKVTVILSLSALALIGISDAIPVLEKIPGPVFSFFFTLVAAFVTEKFQRKALENHISEGGTFYSAGRALLICIISIFILVAVFLGAFLLLDAGI